MNNNGKRLGGHVLVEALIAQGVELIFGVPGESYLAVLDGLHQYRDRVRFISCRNEGGASFMAEAHGKLMGRPSVCMVTRGPGATNGSIGVHTAFQDSTPMIFLVGQVGRNMIEREGFQELDYRRVFGEMTKWVAQIDDAKRIPEFIARAFAVATSGRPGPVVLALPEDMLADVVDSEVEVCGPSSAVQASPSAKDIDKVFEMLAIAQRPIVIAGGSTWTQDGIGCLRRFAERNHLPVACAFRFQDVFDNRHPLYAGDIGLGINPELRQRIQESDLVVAIGPRLGEATTGGYTLLDVPRPRQRLVHIHAGVAELGRVYQADLLINAGMAQISLALEQHEPIAAPLWGAWAAAINSSYRRWIERKAAPGSMQLWDVLNWLKSSVPDDSIITNGAGNYTVWIHRFWQHSKFRTQLAPTSGAMGYGVPAAIAAKIAYPSRTVIAFAGDGCFLMNGQEIATAVQYGANVVFIVINNGMYGTIRMHQEREFPANVIGTDLINPDFAAYARAFGAHGEIVTDSANFAEVFERCVAAGKPSLIELRVDPQAISPNITLDQLRVQALANSP
jgi:acetolactate synthase I/II/III large subunit